MGKRSIDRRIRNSGITIVEILVILACLALLAGILLPIFAYVRELGYRTKCASNMEQLAKAFQTYSQDWSDYWPCPGGLVGNRSYWSQSGGKGIEGYLKQRGKRSVFCCPGMPDWRSSIYGARTYTMNSYLREPADVEYDYNDDRKGCNSILKGIRTSNIPKMNGTVLLFEGLPLTCGWENTGYYVYIYRCCNWTGAKGYDPKLTSPYVIGAGRPWHGKMNNYIYADGHLVTRQPGRKTAGVLSTHREMLDWYVDKQRFETKLWPTWAKQGVPLE